MTKQEKKLRKALKAYGVEDEAIEKMMAEMNADTPEVEDDSVAAEEPNVDAVGETEEAKGDEVVNEDVPIEEQPSELPEDGDKADEVGASEDAPIEENAEGDENGESVPSVDEPMAEQLEEAPNPEVAPEAPKINLEEQIALLLSKNEELEKANQGYDARLKAMEEIVAALGEKEAVPLAPSFGDAARESPAGKDYVDTRGEILNKLNK